MSESLLSDVAVEQVDTRELRLFSLPSAVVESIVVGLMRATKTVIWPDGRQTFPWPESYDRMQASETFKCYFGGDYAATAAVAAQWRAWWGTHKQEFEKGAYSARPRNN